MSTLPANLSFWVTDEPITLKQLDSAESLLVKIYYAFLDLYVTQGCTYRKFCKRALKSLCSVAINYKIVPQSVNKTVEAYSRVYDVLKEHRQQVIEAFTRKSGFDIEAALSFLRRCETRRLRGKKSASISYADAETYEAMAKCANDFGVFHESVTGANLIEFRNGNLTEPLTAFNISKAVFFLSLMERLHLLPRDWKNRTVNNKMLKSIKTGKIPSLRYLQTSAERNDAEQYLADTTSTRYISRESFYSAIARAVRNAVRPK